MPGPSTVNLPKTNDAYEFEQMVADVLSKIHFTTFQPFGRRGQKQYGVDALSTENSEIVAQCKNIDLSETIIDNILNAFSLEQKIKQFIIATSMNSDTKIQLYVSGINISKKYNFNICIMFWDNIVPVLFQHQALYTKYYGNFVQQMSQIDILRNAFNEGIQKYQILIFLHKDIFAEGIPIDLPTEVDCFIEELLYLLNKQLLQQNENIYKSIKRFCEILDSLTKYIGYQLFPSTNYQRYTYIPDYNIDDPSKRKIISENISLLINELNQHYGIINKGMTLFP